MQEVKVLEDKVKELKRIIEILDQEGVDKCEKLEAQAKRIKSLEKALEKACNKLEESEWQDGNDYHYITSEEWKERCMKEE